MGFTLPNSVDAAFSRQAKPDSADIDGLVKALAGKGVIDGGDITYNGDLTVNVADVTTPFGTAAGVTLDLSTAVDGSLDVMVAIYVDNTNTINFVASAPNAKSPTPLLTANQVYLYQVYLPPTTAVIDATYVIDKRAVIQQSIVTLTENWALAYTGSIPSVVVAPGATENIPWQHYVGSGDASLLDFTNPAKPVFTSDGVWSVAAWIQCDSFAPADAYMELFNNSLTPHGIDLGQDFRLDGSPNGPGCSCTLTSNKMYIEAGDELWVTVKHDYNSALSFRGTNLWVTKEANA